jgi:hypothetical protein
VFYIQTFVWNGNGSAEYRVPGCELVCVARCGGGGVSGGKWRGEMKNSPRTTIMGLLIAIVILFMIHWNVLFSGAGGMAAIHELEMLLLAIFIALLGFFAADEVTH